MTTLFATFSNYLQGRAVKNILCNPFAFFTPLWRLTKSLNWKGRGGVIYLAGHCEIFDLCWRYFIYQCSIAHWIQSFRPNASKDRVWILFTSQKRTTKKRGKHTTNRKENKLWTPYVQFVFHNIRVNVNLSFGAQSVS